MKNKKIMCEFCGKYEARSKDYRTFDGLIAKYLVCNWCRNLDNVTIYRIREEKLDPIDFFTHIDYENLPIEELSELEDKYSCKIAEQIEDGEDLDTLLEISRHLTLREESV